MLLAPKRYESWEVVDSKSVEPIPIYYDDEGNLEVIRMSRNEITAKYSFDMKNDVFQPRQVLVFAKQQLLKEISELNYNVLLMEGWTLTILRKGKACRVEVTYRARPGLVNGPPRKRLPPFIEVLDR